MGEQCVDGDKKDVHGSNQTSEAKRKERKVFFFLPLFVGDRRQGGINQRVGGKKSEENVAKKARGDYFKKRELMMSVPERCQERQILRKIPPSKRKKRLRLRLR